jgi:hypothetical protein
MVATRQAVTYIKSHGDSNRCTPCRGKSDQHTTRFSRLVHVWTSTISISCSQHIATLHELPTELDRVIAPEKRKSRLHPQHIG